MRPTLAAIIVALVLVTAAFLFVVPNAGKNLPSSGAAPTGLRTSAVPTYSVYATAAANPVLAGYSDAIYYQVLNNTNHGPASKLSNVTILGTYYNHAHTQYKVPGTPAKLSGAPVGTWAFIMPLNASNSVGFAPVFTIWANSSSLSMNASVGLTVFVGALTFGLSSVCDEVTGVCGSLVTTDPALISVRAVVNAGGGGIVGAPNETLKLQYFSTGSSAVTVPGAILTLTTDYQGYAHETFFPNSTIFNVPGPNHNELQIIDSVNTSATAFVNVTWTLHNPTGTADFAFWLNSPQYYGGDMVTANWQWRGTNATVGAITLYNYYVRDVTTHAVIASGTPNTIAPSGSFAFALPATYYGTFDVDAYAHNSSNFWTLVAVGSAYAPTLLLNPSEIYYNPGDTVVMTTVTHGSLFSSATITAVVDATNSGQQLFNGPVSGGTFQFVVPATAPAPAYRVLAWAWTPTAGTFASFEGTINEATGFTFWAGVTTQSMYADGSFQAGQTVQLSYKVGTQGTTTLPSTIELEIFPGVCVNVCGINTPALKIWFALSTSGTVGFTIPSDTSNGFQSFTVWGFWAGGDGESQVSLNVNSAPSALNYELGAGSGVTVGWLILLILIVIGGILIFSMMRRRGRAGTMVMSPATTSPSSAAEWKEPATGGTSGGSATPPASPPGA